MRGFQKVVFSPIELEYLKKHQHDPVSQLTIALSKSTTAIKKKLAELDGKLPKKEIFRTQTSKKGRRKDCDNLFLRSTWEASCFRWIRYTHPDWLIEYEPHTFSFAPFGILKGTVSYMPDFKITPPNGNYFYIEVKGGFLKAQDCTKIKRFRKYYPEEFKRLQALVPGPTSKTSLFFKSMGVPIIAHYPDLNKQYRKVIPGWGT